MKRKVILMVAIFAALLAGLIAVYSPVLLVGGPFVLDHSGERRGEDIYWDDVCYVPCDGQYTEDKTLAKTKDGEQINEVKEDESHTFVVVRSFLDNQLFVREDYTIPSSGDVTAVFWKTAVPDDPELYGAIAEILTHAETDFSFETEEIYSLTDSQQMRALYVGYEDCPVATNYEGYLGKYNGEWYLTTKISETRDSSGKKTVSCYTIPEVHSEILEEHLK